MKFVSRLGISIALMLMIPLGCSKELVEPYATISSTLARYEQPTSLTTSADVVKVTGTIPCRTVEISSFKTGDNVVEVVLRTISTSVPHSLRSFDLRIYGLPPGYWWLFVITKDISGETTETVNRLIFVPYSGPDVDKRLGPWHPPSVPIDTVGCWNEVCPTSLVS